MAEAPELQSVPEFREDCPCRKSKCERHGRCSECHTYHAAGKGRPYCLRKPKFLGKYPAGEFSPAQPR